mmetsp:Transcript_3147/g.4534  ORF Transcript_3147/g.4534 Transcript_3147/m.4534 type:complete len:250 (+) Transcript_3147:23-772(+)
MIQGQRQQNQKHRHEQQQQQQVLAPRFSFLFKNNSNKKHFFMKSGSSSSQLFLFGGIFGSNDDTTPNKEKGELAIFTKLAGSDDTDERTLEVKYEGLKDYIRQWSLLFDTDPKGMGLTTPVKVFESSSSPGSNENHDTGGQVVKSVSGVRIVFQSTKTGNGYKSKEEERAIESIQDETGMETTKPKHKDKKPKKEGGVEILVEQLLESNQIQVRAQRCEVDEDTMIKEMSEETIIKELKKAIDVWKKQQ